MSAVERTAAKHPKRPTVSQVRKPVSAARSRVEILRLEAGLGTRELAQYAGVSPATVSRIESGKAPDICSAIRLARFFETSVEDLFSQFAEAR